MPSKVQLTPADCAATALKQQNYRQGAILFLKECHREGIQKVCGCYQDGFIAYVFAIYTVQMINFLSLFPIGH